MSRGRPRTAIGTFGTIHVSDLGGRYRALTRFRDLDGRLRRVTATARSRRGAEALLKERLLNRARYGLGGPLGLSSPFRDLVELWLETGVLGAAVLLAFLLWWAAASWRIWRAAPSGGDSLAQAAAIVTTLLIVHSLADYPLRTLALAGVFALACALMEKARTADAS